MKLERAAGILLHPTSLPGGFGIGDLGPAARSWIDDLAESGCSLWQVLPLGPTGYGDSPYQCFSSFAGNPYLLSPELLVEDGLLEPGDLAGAPALPDDEVDYGAVIRWKLSLLDRAFHRFAGRRRRRRSRAVAAFREEHGAWLDDFALFMAIKEVHESRSWVEWPPPLRDRHPGALRQARETLVRRVQRHLFFQFLFFRQWAALRDHAAAQRIRIVGDLPIFVAHDSADVWADRELFLLGDDGRPTVVAGVPPDYFSATGQLWGNPLYRWEAHRAGGYDWWLRRLGAVLDMVDVVRLDHFRGFAGYWEVPGDAPTAERGRWVDAPGEHFLTTVRDTLGSLPIIAEDLGEITPDVIALRDTFELPGMKILQFAFSDDESNEFLPHHYPDQCVVYTGTHDNDTTIGWYQTAPAEERAFARRYLGVEGRDIAWDLIEAAWKSRAAYAVAPLQDVLRLGPEARMNYPGRPAGNWRWRAPATPLPAEPKERLRRLNQETERRGRP